MRVLGNLDLQQNFLQNAALEAVTNFPETPVTGQVIFKDQRVLICVELDEGLPIWAPLTAQMNTHIHEQAVAATTWTIDHELNAAQVIPNIIGADGKHVIPDEITYEYNQLVVTFSEPQAGKAILMIGNTDGTQRLQYNYEQQFTSASTTWVVNHMLGYNPVIRVYVGNFEVQPQSIVHDDTNTTTITFSTAQVGYVRAL